jgi:hypothetical protein
VVYNITDDRDHALEIIWLNKPHCHGTEFIIVVLPYGNTFLQENQNPRSDSVEVGAPLRSRPYQGPYIGYWPSRVSFDAVHWHKIVWNKHLSIGYNVHINFNDILNNLIDDDDEDDDDEEKDDDDKNDDDDGEDQLALSPLPSSDEEDDDADGEDQLSLSPPPKKRRKEII